MKRPSAVLYHYPCTDGVFAALASHLFHKARGQEVHFFPNTVYRPLKVNELNAGDYETFYLLDFSGPDGFALDLCKKAKRVVILDHHKTAAAAMPGDDMLPKNLHLVFDMHRSGATIAYDYFRECLEGAQLLPSQDAERVEKMFKYVEDGDLWRWSIPESKAFMNGLKALGLEYDARANPSIFNQLLQLDIASVLAQGTVSLSDQQAKISSALEKSFKVQIGDDRFLAVRADELQHYRSDLGHQLAEKSLASGLRPIGAVVYEVEALGDSSKLKVSLRSIDADTTGISQAHGGGGHRCASSFMVEKHKFEQFIVS